MRIILLIQSCFWISQFLEHIAAGCDSAASLGRMLDGVSTMPGPGDMCPAAEYLPGFSGATAEAHRGRDPSYDTSTARAGRACTAAYSCAASTLPKRLQFKHSLRSFQALVYGPRACHAAANMSFVVLLIVPGLCVVLYIGLLAFVWCKKAALHGIRGSAHSGQDTQRDSAASSTCSRRPADASSALQGQAGSQPSAVVLHQQGRDDCIPEWLPSARACLCAASELLMVCFHTAAHHYSLVSGSGAAHSPVIMGIMPEFLMMVSEAGAGPDLGPTLYCPCTDLGPTLA